MFAIHKITQRYDGTQDRICLSVAADDGQVMQLWLTQRLCNRLAGALVGWLDEGMEASQRALGLQAWEQASAKAQHAPTDPVALAGAVAEVLIHTINLHRSATAYMVDFKWDADSAARLAMAPTELRQWLAILYRMVGQAEWPKHAWPAWFSDSALDQQGASSSFH